MSDEPATTCDWNAVSFDMIADVPIEDRLFSVFPDCVVGVQIFSEVIIVGAAVVVVVMLMGDGGTIVVLAITVLLVGMG